MTKRPCLLSGQRGNAALAVLGSCVVSMIFVAGLADLGIFFLARARAQIAADAAALAAAAELIPGIGGNPAGQAMDFAKKNRAEMVTCDCSSGAQAVEVQVAIPVRFMLISGSGPGKVSARARAEVNLDGWG